MLSSKGKMTSFQLLSVVSLLLRLCILVSSDHINVSLTPAAGVTRTSASRPVDEGQPLSLAALKGWGIFLMVLTTCVCLCLCIFVACKVITGSSRDLMERIYPGVHVMEDNEAISTGRCTRINF